MCNHCDHRHICRNQDYLLRASLSLPLETCGMAQTPQSPWWSLLPCSPLSQKRLLLLKLWLKVFSLSLFNFPTWCLMLVSLRVTDCQQLLLQLSLNCRRTHTSSTTVSDQRPALSSFLSHSFFFRTEKVKFLALMIVWLLNDQRALCGF